MDKAESIVTVDDAIKKLVLLDSKDKIWTQEVLLQVTDKAVRLLDCDTQVRLVSSSVSDTFCPTCVCVEDESQLASVNGFTLLLLQEELENFPLSIIQLSQSVMNKTRYPSVLLLVCQDKDQHKPDIHFFHCDEVDVSLAAGIGHLGHVSWISVHVLMSCVCVQAEIVHADIDSALGDSKHGKKMRPQTLK